MTIICVLKNSRLNSLADPGGNFRQDRASVEEVENHDRHDHRHRRHCHHEGQVDSWQKICLQWTINGRGKIVFFFPTLNVEKGARANFCASAAQKFPHSQTYAQTAIWKYACVCSWFVCLRFVFFPMCYCFLLLLLLLQTNQRDGLAGLRHPLRNGQHEHREGENHLRYIL